MTIFFVSVILGKSHYVLFNLVSAMQPRMLVTFDTDLRPLPVSVRVGQVSGLFLLTPILLAARSIAARTSRSQSRS